MEILGQCKHEEKSIPVKYIREFAGSIEAQKRSSLTLGCFVSASPFSEQSKIYATTSTYPMVLLVYDHNDDKFKKAYLNISAQGAFPNLLISPDYESNEVVFLYKNNKEENTT